VLLYRWLSILRFATPGAVAHTSRRRAAAGASVVMLATTNPRTARSRALGALRLSFPRAARKSAHFAQTSTIAQIRIFLRPTACRAAQSWALHAATMPRSLRLPLSEATGVPHPSLRASTNASGAATARHVRAVLSAMQRAHLDTRGLVRQATAQQ
jgi:hypothetical protein